MEGNCGKAPQGENEDELGRKDALHISAVGEKFVLECNSENFTAYN